MSVLTNSFAIACVLGAGFVLAYFTYGRFIARRVLGFVSDRPTPAQVHPDGVDYVPTHRAVLFGHHFASIAGLGPIVGPAVAVMWGWGPALLWIFFGTVFLGAVHDLATLYASLRHDGRGIGDLTNEVIGARARILFLVVIFFLLALAMGVFAMYMARLLTDICPQAVIPTVALIAIAVLIGLCTYKLRWGLGRVTVLGFVLMIVALFVGLEKPVPLWHAHVSDPGLQQLLDDAEAGRSEVLSSIDALTPGATSAALGGVGGDAPPADEAFAAVAAGAQAQRTWTYLLLAYALVASVIPVWLLLQPRDYINSYQLYLGVVLLLLGFLVSRPQIVLRPFTSISTSDEPLFPFLFITIACGAISGFHNLVSSGTTVRQIRTEADAPLIGYGCMLTEGFLAVLVVLACVCGLSQTQLGEFYGGGRVLGLEAFLTGAGEIISRPFAGVAARLDVSSEHLGLFCKSLMAVVVISFAMTTLDSATRLLRFNIEEIGKVVKVRALQNRLVASVLAVSAIGLFAFTRINGRPAGITLWQLFGTTNQLLAAIGLLVVSVLLYKMRKPVIYTAIPMVLVVISVGWGMSWKLMEFHRAGVVGDDGGSFALFVVGSFLMVLALWLVVESFLAFRRYRRLRQDGASAAMGAE